MPAYNEAFRLPVVLDALRHHVAAATTEIVIVDDGSSDATGDVARRAGDWVSHLVVLRHEVNRGKGAAVRTGVAAARGDVIAFVDADNATDLDALAPMVAALGPNVAAVFGSRHAPGSSVTGAPAIRGVMGRVFNHVVRVAAGTSIRDTQCGAKVFRGAAARAAFGPATVDGFAFDVEVLRRLLTMGLGVVEYPVDWHYVHGTKIRFSSPMRMLRDIARIRMARSSGPFLYIDCEWCEKLDVVADPLDVGQRIEAGRPTRILLPFGADPADGTGAEVSRLLSPLGVPFAAGQSRTWLQLIGTSPS